MGVNQQYLDHLLKRMVDDRQIFSVAKCIENGTNSFSWSGAAGDMKADSRFFIASVTKLYITAVVLRLIEEGLLKLDDKISKYLPSSYCDKLHVYKGVDYSEELTVCHLISNTSGLPDYFFCKQENGRTAADELLDGHDAPWPLDKTIPHVKKLRPGFKPGQKGKATYSDTNYQLLGRIIEIVTGKPIGIVFQDNIFSPLNLKNTYIYSDVNDDTPVPFYYKSKQLWLPEYITSISPEGGIVSTVKEVMVFLKAFFNGTFFPIERINELKKWNLMLPPPGFFYYGVGLEKLWIPWFVSPFKPIGEILGFWGQTGSFAFYNPKTDLYFCGATNQINGYGHRMAVKTIMKTIKKVR